jgi:hypothetical protein
MGWLHNFSWIISISEVKPGGSSVLGNNYPLFYTIHSIAIIVILCSTVICLLVINSIRQRVRKRKRKRGKGIWTKKDGFGFSDRFPLYIALTDLLYGVVYLSDHLHLLIRKTFPTKEESMIHGVLVCAFIG